MDEYTQKSFGVSYAKCKVPDDCILYNIKTTAPKGLGNFDRLISAKSAKEAATMWKRVYSYMGNAVKIVSVEEVEGFREKVYDRRHCSISGRLTIIPELFVTT